MQDFIHYQSTQDLPPIWFLATISVFLFVTIYMLPTWIGIKRGANNRVPIAWLNLFFGLVPFAWIFLVFYASLSDNNRKNDTNPNQGFLRWA